MHAKARDLTGMTVGYLTATRYLRGDGRNSIWEAQCAACGGTTEITASDFLKCEKRGVVASCGCMRRQTISSKNKRHGMSRHPAFAVWHSMKERCETPTYPAFKNYGARGIKVCERWSNSFEAFWTDMGSTYKQGLTLDRIDNDGDYTPDNCRWVDYTVQANNRRRNHMVGTETAAQFARRVGVKYTTILYRLFHGVPMERLGETPDTTRKFST